MKNQVALKKIVVALAVAGMFAGVAQAATLATSSAKAKVIAPLSITHAATDALSFGTITVGTVGGTVDIASAGVPARTQTGDVTLVTDAANPASADVFTITSEPNWLVNVNVPATITISDGGLPAKTMTVTTSTSLGASTSFTSSTTGSDTLYVGGSLAVGANQAAATYTGTYNVTVSY